MAETGFTPIQLYRTATSSAAPTAGNLAAGELAINTNDGKLFYKNSAGAVAVMASTSGSTGDVTLNGTQTLTNKTLTSPVLGGITTTASGSMEFLPADYTMVIRGGGSSEGTIKLNCAANSHGQSLTAQPHALGITNEMLLPIGANSTLVSLVSADTLTNKTINYANNTLVGVASLGANTFTATQNLADNIVQRPVLKDYAETKVAMAANAVDLALGNVQTKTISGAQTLTFSNPPASGLAGSFTLILTNGGSAAVTFPSSVDWPAATAPTLTPSGVDVLTFVTIDGGTIWYGIASGIGMA